MKFGKQIQSQTIPGYGYYYLDYKGLKKIINSLLKGRPADAALLAAGVRPPRHSASDEIEAPPESSALIENLDTAAAPSSDKEGALLQAYRAAFFFKLERELEKINAFYLQRENTLKVRLRTLIDKRKILQASLSNALGVVKPLKRDSSAYVALYEGFKSFETDLGKLQQFVEMNATGFRKILKKWDKRAKQNVKELYLSRQVEVQPVFNREFLFMASDVVMSNLMELEYLVAGQTKTAAKNEESRVTGSDVPKEDWTRTTMQDEGSDASESFEEIEDALVNAVRTKDTEAIESLLKGLPHSEQLRPEARLAKARLLWRAALSDVPSSPRSSPGATPTSAAPAIPIAALDFGYVDDISSRTPLHSAAMTGHLVFVRICLQQGSFLHLSDFYGRSALHYAAMNGYAAICAELLAAGADPYVSDFDGYNAMLYSVLSGSDEVVKTFIHAGVSFEPPESVNEDLNPLSLASQFGHEPIAALLLERGAKVYANPAGYWPQHLAAREGHTGVLRLLVAATATSGGIDVADKYSQWTPLFHASSEGHTDAVKVLLDAGTDVMAIDEFSQTAIHYAAWKGHIECVNLLLAAGGRPGTSSSANSSPAIPGSTATVSASSNPANDGDVDMIPSLSLPPPIIPFRIFGHNYLDKKSLVQITLASHAVRLNEQTGRGQHPPLKLIMSSKSDAGPIPHSVILPLSDEQDVFPFQVHSFDTFAIEFDLFPTFGSKVIAKAVASSSMLAGVTSQDTFSVPLVDPHLRVIGDLTFDVNVVKPFEKAQLAMGGLELHTYWKAKAGRADTSSSASGPASAVVTASSLSGEHVRIVVQVTKDKKAVAYPAWFLPIEGFDVSVGQVTLSQFVALGQRLGRTLDPASSYKEPRGWYQAIEQALVPLEDLMQILPPSVGIDVEVRYPTRSDCKRLGISEIAEVNDYVDTVLTTVYGGFKNTELLRRRLVFSSFNPVVCTALNWKQANFAVFFASYCGLSRSMPSLDGKMVSANRVEDDRRCTSIRDAVRFAKYNNILGVMLDATLLVKVPSLIQSAKEEGLLVATFGNTSQESIAGDADAHMTDGVLSYPSRDFLLRTQQVP